MGIAQGSSLSPLLGAFYLMDLDKKMKRLDVKYFRYMDDILVLAPTRWKLKKAIRVMNQTFNELKLEQHPDKTLIGRTERGSISAIDFKAPASSMLGMLFCKGIFPADLGLDCLDSAVECFFVWLLSKKRT